MNFFENLKDAMAKWNSVASKKKTNISRYDYR